MFKKISIRGGAWLQSYKLFLLAFLMLLSPLIKAEDFEESEDQQNLKQDFKSVRLGYENFRFASAQKSNHPGTLNKILHSNNSTALNKISATGFIRFVSIYRNMSTSYIDQESSDKNLAFADYPFILSNAAFNSSYPLVDLNLQAKPTSNTSFIIGYTFGHTFTGQGEDSSRTMNVRSNLNFDGKIHTKNGSFRLQAGGGVLWTSLSPFTIGNVEYRDNYFERLPWDWYTNSFQKYKDYYSSSLFIGSERAGNAALQGFILSGERLPLGFGFTGVYGRSVASVALDRARTHFPSMLYAGRIDKMFSGVKVGVNYYNQSGWTDQVRGIKDQCEIATADVRFKTGPLTLYSEIGAGRVLNPLNDKDWGTAINVTGEIQIPAIQMPVTVRVYNIDKNVVSLVSNSINSNPTVMSGGFGGDPVYTTTTMFVNVAQEVGQMSNNRRGLVLKTEKALGKLNISFGTGISQEIENYSDTITIQHRVNAFSRSRFRPWYQAGGPYGRIKSVWLRTFETLTVSDSVKNYKKGFNGLDLQLKYKLRLFNRELILINYNNFNSIQDGLSIIPQFSDKAFVRVFYEEFTAMYQVAKKHTFVSFCGLEKVWGNERINLSPENGKTIHQTGYGLGLGWDYDFSDNAGIYLRHRWMSHEDQNFIQDKFKGQETTVEFKLFF